MLAHGIYKVIHDMDEEVLDVMNRKDEYTDRAVDIRTIINEMLELLPDSYYDMVIEKVLEGNEIGQGDYKAYIASHDEIIDIACNTVRTYLVN